MLTITELDNHMIEISKWKEHQKIKRAIRLNDLKKALSTGKKVIQIGRIWPDSSPFLPKYNTPEYLAEHIENREHGFGFKTEIIWN